MPDQVETTAGEGMADALAGGPEPSPEPSSAVPATHPATPEPTFEQRLEIERRRWQSGKDREIAVLRQKQQEELRALHEVYGQRLAQLGDNDREQFIQGLAERQKARAYDDQANWAAEQQRVQATAQSILDIFGAGEVGVTLDHPAFQKQMDWDEFRSVAAQTVKTARQASEEKAAAERRKAADARLRSGELATLGGGPAQPTNQEREIETLYDRLQQAQADPEKNWAERRKILARLRELGEKDI